AIELLGDTAGLLDLPRHQLAHVLEVDMAGHELGKGVRHRDDGLVEVLVLHACGAPQGAGAGHVATLGGGTGAIGGHISILVSVKMLKRQGYHGLRPTSDCTTPKGAARLSVDSGGGVPAGTCPVSGH